MVVRADLMQKTLKTFQDFNFGMHQQLKPLIFLQSIVNKEDQFDRRDVTKKNSFLYKSDGN